MMMLPLIYLLIGIITSALVVSTYDGGEMVLLPFIDRAALFILPVLFWPIVIVLFLKEHKKVKKGLR